MTSQEKLEKMVRERKSAVEICLTLLREDGLSCNLCMDKTLYEEGEYENDITI